MDARDELGSRETLMKFSSVPPFEVLILIIRQKRTENCKIIFLCDDKISLLRLMHI